ncbi:IGF-like family receptor 1 [Triplophysa tibetana]|uniref:IGF-like family receptor 1 n=1 Tax=Triplophysa tibetana TaxID=1572043 RepID=A0A5A9N115_9TELE|nr:IGF-like family receptor 1 [Triplophysa tibetana]
MTSHICVDEEYRIDYLCERCEKKFPIKKGFEFNPNCGRDDNGNQVYDAHRKCINGTFNNGSFVKCQKCNTCPPRKFATSLCSAESDVVCCTEGEHVLDGRCTDRPVKTTAKTIVITTESRIGSSSVRTSDSITSTSPTCTLSPPNYVNVTEKGRNGEMQEILECKTIQPKAVFSIIDEDRKQPLSLTATSFKLLDPEIQAATLNTVLNNLDVLEELILLLDPDQISGAKNTRHLAAQCSFSFAWINYAYSKKDHKSPLVAVLEGVVAKNPDWTVGHLAGLLSGIGRNDAVEILAKLHASEKEY